MAFRRWIAVAGGLAFCASAMALAGPGKVDCVALNEKASQAGDFRPPLEAKVAGEERLHFHDAPDPACVRKAFVIPGDALTVYKSRDGWMQVMFVGRSGQDTSGWVKEDRLRIAGQYGGGDASKSLPAEVRAFMGRRDECEHFLGEEPYDEERRKYLAEAVRDSCNGANKQLKTLREKYRHNSAVLEALADYYYIAE